MCQLVNQCSLVFLADPWSMPGSHFGWQNPQRNHVKVLDWDRERSEEGNTSHSWCQMLRHIRSRSAKWKRWNTHEKCSQIDGILLNISFHFRTWKVPCARFRRHKLPSVADPPQGWRRLRNAIKDLRHPTEYYDRFRYAVVWSHCRVLGEFHQGKLQLCNFGSDHRTLINSFVLSF